MHWWHIGLDVGVGTFNVEKGKKAKWQTERKNFKIYIYIYIYISWRVFNTVENLSWSKVHWIWKRKSGIQGRKYLAKCLTRWKMIWSKIFDLMKAVFACETVRLLPAFSQKSLAINCRLFHEPPPLTNHKSYWTRISFLSMTWLIKSLFWQITIPMETRSRSVNREKKLRNENWLDKHLNSTSTKISNDLSKSQ